MSRFTAFAQVCLGLIFSFNAMANSQDVPSDTSHYAFANYLGSGVYRTSEQSAAVLNIPLQFELVKFPDSELYLRLPVSVGFFNYNFTDLPNGDLPTGVGTMVIAPGLEYHWKGDTQWRYESYMDLGYGYTFTNDNQVGIFSTGISALYDLDLPRYSPIWVNRLFYAGYRNKHDHSTESFSALSSGIETGLGRQWQWGSVAFEPRLFMGANWYFDKLKFSAVTKADTFTNYSVELGFSLQFAKPLGWEYVNIKRAGLSYQVGEGLRVIKLHFDFPL